MKGLGLVDIYIGYSNRGIDLKIIARVQKVTISRMETYKNFQEQSEKLEKKKEKITKFNKQ